MENKNNKYNLLKISELENLVDAIDSFDSQVKHLFIQELIEELPTNKLLPLLKFLLSKDFFYGQSKKEIEIFLALFEKIFTFNSTSTIYKELSDFNEPFLFTLSHSEKLLAQHFEIIIKEDNKSFSALNSFIYTLIYDTNLINDSDFFKQIFISHQDKLKPSVIKEGLTICTKPLNFYALLSEKSKEILSKNKQDLNDTFTYFIRNAVKKDNLSKKLKGFNLLDKLNPAFILLCLEQSKGFLLNSLFSKEDISQQLKIDFWNVALMETSSIKDNISLIKRYLSKEEIQEHLKTVIKSKGSFDAFYNLVKQKQLSPKSMLIFIDTFYDELSIYLKENPIKLLEAFTIKHEKNIKHHFYMHSDDYEKEYQSFLISIQENLLDKTLIKITKQPSKKIKI